MNSDQLTALDSNPAVLVIVEFIPDDAPLLPKSNENNEITIATNNIIHDLLVLLLLTITC